MPMLSGMADALRLVRAGQLKQALGVIQDGLRERDTAPIDGSYTRVPDPTPAPAYDVPADERPGEERPADTAPDTAPPASPAERFESHAFTNAAGTRQYKLYVPASYAGEAMPLVVMLHGCTQSPDDFAAGTRMNDLAAHHGFLVAYPAQPGSANPNKCWNWFKRSEQARERGEPSLIAGIVNAVKSRYAVDDRRVFVAGLSSGGAMAATLAATYPEMFAAVGVHSGLPYGCAHDLPSGLAAMRSGRPGAAVARVPTIVFHGDRDSVVHPRNGEALAAQQVPAELEAAVSVDSAADANGHAYTRRSLRAESGQPLVEHWVIHGAGHAWSGGSPRGSHTDPRGPDASSEMLRFFLASAPR